MVENPTTAFMIISSADITKLHNQSVQKQDDDSHQTDQLVTEVDCACADDGFTLGETAVSSPPPPKKKYNTPQLHTQDLNDQFSFAFNPLGSAGVVLLNHAVKQILQQFQEPKPLAEGLAKLGNPPGGQEALQKLILLNLIQPEGIKQSPRRGEPQTLITWLHVTNACNLRCPYCYLHKTSDQMELAHGRLSIDAIFRSATANNFKRVKIKYAGGEATLNLKTVLALHTYANECANQFGLELDGVVLSNGVSISPKMIDALKASQLRLMISLDGIGAVHDAQRPLIKGQGSFSRIERSLDHLQKAGFIPSISITITNRNLATLAETVRYVLDRNLPFSLNFYRDNECATSFVDLNYNDIEIIQAMKQTFALIESDLPQHSLLGAILDRTRLDTPHERPCGVGQTYLVIDQNGNIAKCQMEIEQTITDIHAADPLNDVRTDTIHLQNPSVDEKEGCKKCHWRYWCAGGCPALTFRTTGRFDIKSPNCNIYQSLFPAALRLEGLRLLKQVQQLN